MSDQKLKIAVFIDFDNVEIGVKTTLGRQFDVGAVLEAIKERGEIITKIAYGDWKRAGDYGRTMSQHAVRLVQRVMTPGGDKNGADINLALDALEMAFTHAHINAFVIVGGDSDFITLVEKLKQYDRKVFVVGGRAFSSQVMQKNCTEFIAYENIAGAGTGAARQSGTVRSDRGRASGASIEQALPLVKRALKVLNEREVSPQLGLLKSTLLQLDSSFSERDYGSSTFRDFAEKLEQRGYVTLKHSGRTTIVELTESGSRDEGRPEGTEVGGGTEVPAVTEVGAGTEMAMGTEVGPQVLARRWCCLGSRGACGGHDAASLADVSAADEAVHPRGAAGLRRTSLRIAARAVARVSERRSAQARTRPSGRVARVCRRSQAVERPAWVGEPRSVCARSRWRQRRDADDSARRLTRRVVSC